MLEHGKRVARRALLTLLYPQLALRNAGYNRAQPREIKRVLVIRPDNLGDLLFATPALARLRKAFPGAHITGAVGPWGRSMWEGNPSLNSLMTVPFPGMALRETRGKLSPYLILGVVARKLAMRRYDLGLALRFDHWWGSALISAAGIPHRWGYDTPGVGAWLTGKVQYIEGRHEVEQDLRLVQECIETLAGGARATRVGPLNLSREQGQPPLRPPQPRPPSGDVLAEWFASPRRLVIHPGTGAANKLWLIRSWAEVAERLARQEWSVAITGSSGERKLAEAIVEATDAEVFNAAGQTGSLGELAWVFERAAMVLGVDSGPLHIATALGKPTIHLYGPSNEAIWGPWGDPARHRVLRAPGTHPTGFLDVGSTELEGGPDMRAITPEMMMHEIGKLQTLASSQ